MRFGCLCIALVAACGFEHGTSVTRDDAPPGLDDVPVAVDAPGDTMNVVIDAPPDSSLPPTCSATGLVCVGTTVAVTCNGACWVGCTQTANVPNQDHAVTACTAWGGKLAPIRTQADQNCVEQMLFPGQFSWIGFEQSSMATSLTTGWSWNSDGLTPTYTHWDSGQPNDVNGNENDHAEQCAYMGTNGQWGDSQCGNAAYFRFSCRK